MLTRGRTSFRLADLPVPRRQPFGQSCIVLNNVLSCRYMRSEPHVRCTFARLREEMSQERTGWRFLAQPSTFKTAAPSIASFFKAFRARLASRSGKSRVWVRIGISAATRRKSSPSLRVLLATLRITRS